MVPRPHILAESTWKAVRETPYEVAVLPWGATEAHNLHLPYGTDTLQSERVAAEAARLANLGGRGSWSCRRCRSASTRGSSTSGSAST